MAFGEWIANQVDRTDEVGHIAQLVRIEKRMRPERNTLAAWVAWLELSMDSPAFQDLIMAWSEYRGAI